MRRAGWKRWLLWLGVPSFGCVIAAPWLAVWLVQATAPRQVGHDSDISAAAWDAAETPAPAIHLRCDAQRLAAMAWDAGRGPWSYLVLRDRQSFFGHTGGPLRIPWRLDLVDAADPLVQVRMSAAQCDAWLSTLLVPPHVPAGWRMRVERLLLRSRPVDEPGVRRIDLSFAGQVVVPLPMSMRVTVQSVSAEGVIRWEAASRQVTTCTVAIEILEGDLLVSGDLDLFRSTVNTRVNMWLQQTLVNKAIAPWVPLDATVDVLVETGDREL